MNDESNNHDDPIDQAVARRLSKLRSMPMDTAAFDAKLRAALPAAGSSSERRLLMWPVSTPLRAVAASLILGLTLFFMFVLMSPRPALATPQRMAEIYQSAIDGRSHSTKVTSIEEARAALHRKWPESPVVPDVNNMQLMHCCVHEIGRKQMACLTFEVGDAKVTLAIAPSRDIRSPHGESRVINGREYLVGTSDGVNMVMSESDDTWMCLMGELPIERLAELANSIRN
jgi:hypothetical protein